MRVWNAVFTTDPRAVKPITGKAYKGNSPKPYWMIQRMTEEFGPIGFGWGIKVKNERFERMTDTDVLHVATVEVWYVLDGVRSEGWEQMGGTKACYQSKNGMIVDEDAGKKSVTDGMVKCMSMQGFAGDIFSGMWDDSKYVDHALEVHLEKERAAAMTPEERAAQEAQRLRGAELDELASYLIECHQAGTDMPAIKAWYLAENWSKDNPTEQSEREYVWGLLRPYSKLRSTIKANKPQTGAQVA